MSTLIDALPTGATISEEPPIDDQGPVAENVLLGQIVDALKELQANVNSGAAGVDDKILSIPVKLANISAGNLVNALTLGIKGTIKSVSFAVTQPATTGSKLATLGLKIGSTAVTGGAVALTSANCTPTGNVVAGSAVTAANVFVATDTISVVGSGVTAFAEGEGVLIITIAGAS